MLQLSLQLLCMYVFIHGCVCMQCTHTSTHIHSLYTLGYAPGVRPQPARAPHHCRRHLALVRARTPGASSCASSPSPTRLAAPCLRPCQAPRQYGRCLDHCVPTSGTQVPLQARQAPRQYESNRGRISRLAACRHRRYTWLRGCPTLDASVAIDYMKHLGSVTGIHVALG